MARIQFAQTLYVLPVSLFGMSIAAAELPELARERGGGTEALRARAGRGRKARVVLHRAQLRGIRVARPGDRRGVSTALANSGMPMSSQCG
ncbi:MAG: hypothetical protein WDO12_05700 [Pseudomonadota bacterium]